MDARFDLNHSFELSYYLNYYEMVLLEVFHETMIIMLSWK